MPGFMTAACIAIAASCIPNNNSQELEPLHLSPNAHEIMQGDTLLLRTVFYNRQDSESELQEPDGKARGYYFRIQIEDEGHWLILQGIGERGGGYGRGGRALVKPGTAYGEYIYVHKHRGSFVFDAPGDYKLRAVARIDSQEITSNVVVIRVARRAGSDLKKITGLGDLSDELNFASLNHVKPQELMAVKSVGGNIGDSIRKFEILQQYATTGMVRGEQVSRDELCALLRREFDAVSYESSLALLAKHFRRQRDLESMLFVVNTMKVDSDARRESVRYLKEKGLEPLDGSWHE